MASPDNISKRRLTSNSLLSALWGRNAMLLLLAWVGGSTDAVSYLGLGHTFTANMTGNTVLLGIAIGQGLLANQVRSFLSMLGFCVGAMIGGILIERNYVQEDWPVIITRMLAIEGVLLAAFALVWYLTDPAHSPVLENILIVLSALAMGLQSAAVLRIGVSGIVTTYVSGTWTSFVMNLVRQFLRGKDANATELSTRSKQNHLGLQLAVLCIYGLAAVISGLGEVHWPKIVPLLPLFIVIIVVVNASIHLHRASPRDENQLQP
jgi:uncharacterized membrane protein YoaK (UPF0700 family)